MIGDASTTRVVFVRRDDRQRREGGEACRDGQHAPPAAPHRGRSATAVVSSAALGPWPTPSADKSEMLPPEHIRVRTKKEGCQEINNLFSQEAERAPCNLANSGT